MAARLKSRLALDLGVGALSSLDLPRADGEGARERAPRKGSKLRITKSVPLDPRKRSRGRGVPRYNWREVKALSSCGGDVVVGPILDG